MDAQLQLTLSRRRVAALGVTQFVRLIRETLETHLDEYWVAGEVSNARLAPSGHLYFTLKDERSAISVVMFRSAALRLRFKLADGMEVMARGRVNLYEARGALQFYADEMEPRGLGALQLAFDQLKEKLAKEGLFEPARKRPLPFLPQTVGVVTALRGAALRDILSVMLKRYPNLRVIVRPARVQGIGAAEEIAAAIDDLNRHGQAEVLIVGRGGGSLEDLWAFNEEAVARAIHRSAIPIITGVGHEVDYTIADFVADQRAPTPTAAALLVVPAKAELRQQIDEIAAALSDAMGEEVAARRRQVVQLTARVREPRNLLRQLRQRTDEGGAALAGAIEAVFGNRRLMVSHLSARLRPPSAMVREMRLRIGRLGLHLSTSVATIARRFEVRLRGAAGRLSPAALDGAAQSARRELAALDLRLGAAVQRDLKRNRQRMAALAAQLDTLSPLRVLERGYAVVSRVDDGRVVHDAAAVEVGDEIDVRLRRGRIRARATAREV